MTDTVERWGFQIVPLPKPVVAPEIAEMLERATSDMMRITGIEQVISDADPNFMTFRVHAEIPRGLVYTPVKRIDFYGD